MHKPFYCDFSTVHSLCRNFHRQHWDAVFDAIDKELCALHHGYESWTAFLDARLEAQCEYLR